MSWREVTDQIAIEDRIKSQRGGVQGIWTNVTSGAGKLVQNIADAPRQIFNLAGKGMDTVKTTVVLVAVGGLAVGAVTLLIIFKK